jgi:surface polysaccharide O-acyltransferase-like enzyme
MMALFGNRGEREEKEVRCQRNSLKAIILIIILIIILVLVLDQTISGFEVGFNHFLDERIKVHFALPSKHTFCFRRVA